MTKPARPSKEDVQRYGFKLPFRCQIAAQTTYGKNRFLEEELMPYFIQQFDQCILLSPPRTRHQDSWKRLRKMWTDEEGNCWFHVVEETGLDAMAAKCDEIVGRAKMKTLVILDDMQHHESRWPWLEELFRSGRHADISIISMTQSAFVNRKNRLNLQYLCAGRLMSMDEMARIFQQRIRKKDCQEKLNYAYERIVDRDNSYPNKPGFLVLDFISTRSSELRARDTALNCVIPQLADC